MSIFSELLHKVFRGPQAKAAQPAPRPGQPAAAPARPAAAAPTPAQPGVAQPQVDVEEVLEGLAVKSQEKLNWRTSIVDLMKLLDMDSSLASRKEMAKELGYTGDGSDSAAMNIWLHKQVMQKLAANGGKVPKELLD